MLRIHPRLLLRRSAALIASKSSISTSARLSFISPKHTETFGLPPFKPPPIRQRLKPLIPFFIYWTIITSLAVHLLRARIQSKEELDKKQAQISILTSLIERFRQGEKVDQVEMQRDLEMVGLRERTVLTKGLEGELTDTADVGWSEVLFGKKRKTNENDVEDNEEKSLEEWVQVVNEATPSPGLPLNKLILPSPSSASSSSTTSQSERSGQTKRAPSSNVYM